MKYLAATALVSALLGLNIAAQSSNATRPRVVPTATPPVITNNPYPTQANNRPPVLSGGRNQSTPSPTSTPPPPTAADDGDIIKVETNLVTMPVSVLDRDGRFISGLRQNDFKIFENGVEQKVDFFQSVEQPFTVALVIDVSPSTAFRIDEIQDAAITFVNQLRPGDRVVVIAFDEDVHVLSPVTNDRRILTEAIREARFGDGTGLYEVVDYVINHEMREIRGRKAVVLFTDGVDTTSRSATYDGTVADTEEVDSIFYTIRYDTSQDVADAIPTVGDVLAGIITGRPVRGGRRRAPGNASPEDYALGKRYLETLAQNSGGREFEAQTMFNIDAAFSGIAEELRQQYSLGYYPESVGKLGDRKQIKIRVMRPGVVVRAKNSYIVGQSDRSMAGR